ncbi:MAG: hypothetical protein HKN23_18755, partial [Verrucomicrobiales bacterium]|nr:hypothetical protein [Verrucomicrobiales bacterium]
MKFSKNIALFLATVALVFGSCAPSLSAQEKDKPEKVKVDGPPPAKKMDIKREGDQRGDKRDPMANLSDEERSRLRQAMREAWSDPAVIQARQEVNDSVQAYQKAIRAALLKKDPEMKGLISKMEASSQSHVKTMIGEATRHGNGGKSGPRAGGGDQRGFDMLTRAPSYLSNLTPEQRKQYFELRDKVKSNPEVRELFGKLEQLRKEDDAMRDRRTDTFRKLGRTIHEAMIAEDPSVAEWLPKGPPGGMKGRGPGGGKGKVEGNGPN